MLYCRNSDPEFFLKKKKKEKKKRKIGEGLILIIYHNFVILHMIYDLSRNMEKSEKKRLLQYCGSNVHL